MYKGAFTNQNHVANLLINEVSWEENNQVIFANSSFTGWKDITETHIIIIEDIFGFFNALEFSKFGGLNSKSRKYSAKFVNDDMKCGNFRITFWQQQKNDS